MKPARRWRRLGGWGLAFFAVKGLLWLTLPLAMTWCATSPG